MDEQVYEYIKYINSISEITKPKMPTFDKTAYTENEYIKAINQIEKDFVFTDSTLFTEQYLKGE